MRNWSTAGKFLDRQQVHTVRTLPNQRERDPWSTVRAARRVTQNLRVTSVTEAAVDLDPRERADTADLDIEPLLRGYVVGARSRTTRDAFDHLVHADLAGAGTRSRGNHRLPDR